MLSQQTVGDLLAALGARTPAPASGSAVALTAALAAALAELAARYAGDDGAAARAQALVRRLVEGGVRVLLPPADAADLKDIFLRMTKGELM